MAGQFMGIKRVTIPMLTLIILSSQLLGCASMKSQDMVDMINKGQSIVLEVAKPSYDIKVKGTQQTDSAWVQLDALKTYNNGFRQGFDEIFNINIVTDNGINGKAGCLYVDETGDRNGNTTLEDAFRNKAFVTKYWNDSAVKTKIGKVADQAYTDVSSSDSYALAGALNAYYNLLPDSKDPSSFNGSQSLSREQFYTLVFRSEEGVKEIKVDSAFATAVGGETANTKYAQGVDQYAFLKAGDKSLDGNTYKGSISRAEAVYMLVKQNFPQELAKASGSDKAYNDTKNGGDIALKAGFKTEKGNQEISKDRWQSYTLAYMLQNPNKGMQSELYKAMVVSNKLGLISGKDSRWDEPISKAEAIMLSVNVQIAKNKAFGYLSEAEYGKINPSKFKVVTDKTKILGKTEDGLNYGDGWIETAAGQTLADPSKKLSSGLSLWESKLALDSARKNMASMGLTDLELQAFLEGEAKKLGTSLAEIQQLPPETVTKETVTPAVVQPVTQPVQKTETTPSKPTTAPTTSSTSGVVEDNPATRNEAGANGGYVVQPNDPDAVLSAY